MQPGGAMGDQKKLERSEWLQIAHLIVFLFALAGWYYQSQEDHRTLQQHGVTLNRVEHYLSSKDAGYWKISKEDE